MASLQPPPVPPPLLGILPVLAGGLLSDWGMCFDSWKSRVLCWEAAFLEALAKVQAESKGAPTVPRRFRLRVAHCPRCHAGHFRVTLFEPNGTRERETEMGAVTMHPEAVFSVTGR
ncbi:MAG: hypothetical protein K8T20_16630 [Planctomycetes bacterium]|nr:hypothetical protein [Planctomycetota bacterium]